MSWINEETKAFITLKNSDKYVLMFNSVFKNSKKISVAWNSHANELNY